MAFKSKSPYLQTQEDIDYWTARFAKHWKESLEEAKKEVEENPELLENYIDHATENGWSPAHHSRTYQNITYRD